MDNIYDILNRFNAASQPLMEGRGTKPDFLDLDRDGDKKEPMTQAARQAKQLDELSPELLQRARDAAGARNDKIAQTLISKDPSRSSREHYKTELDPLNSPVWMAGHRQWERLGGAVGKAKRRDAERQAAEKQAAQAAGTDMMSPAMRRKLAQQTAQGQLDELSPNLLKRATDASWDRRKQIISKGGNERAATDPAYAAAWDAQSKQIDKFQKGLDKAVKRDDLATAGHMLSPAMRRKMGIAEAEMEESNDFIGARLAAIRAGKPTFKVDGKTYKVTGDTSDERVMEKKEKTLFPGTPEYEKRFPKELRPGERAKSSTGGTIEKTATGVKHTARYDDDTDADDDKLDNLKGPRVKGRPKGSKRAIGAKVKGTSKLHSKPAIKEASIETFVTNKGNRYNYVLGDDEMTARIMFDGTEIHLQYDPNMQAFDPQESRAKDPILNKWLKRQQPFGSDEDSMDDFVDRAVGRVSRGPGKGSADQQGISEDYDKDEYDEEGEMAQSQARTIEDAAQELQSILDADENLPEWVQKKISLAMDYIDTARDYLAANRPGDEVVAEKAVSKAQRAAAGIARAAQKGEIPRSELRGASKEMAKMPAGELKKFAKTKEKGLPEKVKKDESVEETTVAGSVAPAVEAPKGKKSGMIFGKGVYEGRLEESYKSRLETMLTEGMSINMSVGEDGRKNLSVTATDDDAVKLAQILKLAGMQQPKGYDDACPTCGAGRGMCEHEMVEEGDLANSADDTVYADTNYMTQTLAGGLNGPKLQVNPNNPADNPLSMRKLGQHSSSSLNLGSEADNLKEETERRLMDLYQRFEAK